MYYVYGYYELDYEHPIYIGKGCGNRLWQHFNAWHLELNDYFHRKLRLMILNDVRVLVKTLVENLTEECALAKEMEYIALYGRRDIGTGCLYNLNDGGGKGNTGWIPSEQTRQNISNGNIGRTLTLDQKIEMSVRLSGRKLPDSHIQNIRKTHTERFGQSIESYDLKTGETVKRYKSIREASRDGFSCGHLSEVVRGLRRKYKGFGWRFVPGGV